MFEEKVDNKTFETASTQEAPALTMEYILEKIDDIMHDNEYLYRAIESIQATSHIEPSISGTDHPAFAAVELVKAREKTNQDMIDLLKRMYETLAPGKTEVKQDVFNGLNTIIATMLDYEMDSENVKDILNTITDCLRHGI